VSAAEAFAMGLVNRVVEPGQARQAAEALALQLAQLPQTCLRSDRAATLLQAEQPLSHEAALAREFRLGLQTIESGETLAGAASFSQGQGRHGQRTGGE
jgi:enoyl-CoA hydratase